MTTPPSLHDPEFYQKFADYERFRRRSSTCHRCLALDALAEVARLNKDESSGERAYDLARGYGYFQATLISIAHEPHELCELCRKELTS